MNERDDSDRLKDCANCGTFGVVSQTEDGGYFIQCTNALCGMSTVLMYATGEDPVPILMEKWNRRAALSAPPTVQPSDAELLAAVAEAGWMARPSDASMLRDAHEVLSGRPPVGISRQTASPQAEAPVPPAGAGREHG